MSKERVYKVGDLVRHVLVPDELLQIIGELEKLEGMGEEVYPVKMWNPLAREFVVKRFRTYELRPA